MSTLLYVGGVLYLLAVMRTTGKRYDDDFLLWQERMRHATIGSVLARQGEFQRKRLNVATAIQEALDNEQR